MPVVAGHRDHLAPDARHQFRKDLTQAASPRREGRRREPARVITIDTPDALRLQHEPVADCARYDTLRSIM